MAIDRKGRRRSDPRLGAVGGGVGSRESRRGGPYGCMDDGGGVRDVCWVAIN